MQTCLHSRVFQKYESGFCHYLVNLSLSCRSVPDRFLGRDWTNVAKKEGRDSVLTLRFHHAVLNVPTEVAERELTQGKGNMLAPAFFCSFRIRIQILPNQPPHLSRAELWWAVRATHCNAPMMGTHGLLHNPWVGVLAFSRPAARAASLGCDLTQHPFPESLLLISTADWLAR